MLFVARIDSFWAVPCKKIDVIAQARHALEHRHANLFGRAWVDRRLINDDIPGFERLSDCFTRFNQGRQIRLLVLINGSGYRHDKHIRLREIRALVGVSQMFRSGELDSVHL